MSVTSVEEEGLGIAGSRLPGLGRWFQFGSRHSWVWQRDAWLPVSGAFTATQFLELDYHVVPSLQPDSGCRMLSGDDPGPRPGEPAERGPIGIGRDDHQASLMALPPGVRDNHPDQIGHLNVASVTRSAARQAILRMT